MNRSGTEKPTKSREPHSPAPTTPFTGAREPGERFPLESTSIPHFSMVAMMDNPVNFSITR